MNTQSHKHVLLSVGALAFFGASFAVQASTLKAKNDSAMDACIEAFVSEQVPLNHPLKIVKRDLASGDTLSRWNFPQRSTIEISAKGARTGQDYGSASCVVDRRGEVVAMQINADRVRMARRDARSSEPQG